jgi:hypothetical protein
LALLPTTWAQQTFSRTYGDYVQTHTTAVCQASNGDLILAGITYPQGKRYSDLWIMQTDPSGEPIWHRTLGGDAPEQVYDLIETRDGNYVLAGVTHHPKTNLAQGLVIQFNRYGETMWSQRYGGEAGNGDQLRAIVQTADGGFAAAGFTSTSGNGGQDFWLLRLDAVGKQRWQQTYGTEGNEVALDLLETRDEGFLLGGSIEQSPANGRDMVLLRTDRRGRGTWRQFVPTPGDDVIEQLVETVDGSYLAAGWGQSPQTNSTDAYLWAVSTTGKVTWTRHFGGKEADVFYDLVAVPGGGYAALGRSASFDQTPDMWLVRLDVAGRSLWQEHTQGSEQEWAHALTNTQDGGFLLAGATRSFAPGQSTSGFLVKTDQRGRFGAAASSVSGQDMAQVAKSDPIPEGEPWFKPNLYVLSIGVSDYVHEPINLTYAHTDAATIGERFAQLEGSLYREVHLKTLTNGEATLANIKAGIAWLEREATQMDMILVFVSSHGALDHKGNLYLLPHDVKTEELFATGLNIEALTHGMNGVPCKKLILLDACHSGQSGHDLLAYATPKAANVNQAIEDLLNKEAGITVMTSSSGNEFSYENPRWGHGAFTKAILEGLDGAADYNRDQLVNLFELNLFVTQRVKDLTGGRQHPFTPINLFGDIPVYVVE